MATLLEHTADIEALNDLLEDMGGDISDAQVAEYVDRLFEETGEALGKKVDGYVGLIREMELQAEARDKEADALKKRAKTASNNARWLKDRLQYVMTRLGLTEAGHARTAKIVNNGGKQPMRLLVASVDDLPPWAVSRKVVVKEDMDALRREIEAGNTEAMKYAEIMPRGTRLSVK